MRCAGKRIGLFQTTVKRDNMNVKQTGRNKERFRGDALDQQMLVGFIKQAADRLDLAQVVETKR